VNKIIEGEYSFRSKAWKTLSQESKDFVSALLQVDSKKRMTARAALAHPWLKNQSVLTDGLPSKETMESVNESIQNYASTGEFKKMALMVIAHQSNARDISELRKVFAAYDTTNDGTITYKEFYQALKQMNINYTDGDIQELFKSVDTGNDDKIYYLEFLAATLEARGRITEERLADAFDRIDSDDSGAISRENLKELLGAEYSDEKIDAFLDEVDIDGDGSISFEEFLRCFQEDQRKQVWKIRADDVVSGNSEGSSIPLSRNDLVFEVGELAIDEKEKNGYDEN
jgi:Ca2+-binding EF-hand superfamily protein